MDRLHAPRRSEQWRLLPYVSVVLFGGQLLFVVAVDHTSCTRYDAIDKKKVWGGACFEFLHARQGRSSATRKTQFNLYY